jgi:hypothetical protein
VTSTRSGCIGPEFADHLVVHQFVVDRRRTPDGGVHRPPMHRSLRQVRCSEIRLLFVWTWLGPGLIHHKPFSRCAASVVQSVSSAPSTHPNISSERISLGESLERQMALADQSNGAGPLGGFGLVL